jgi:phosphoglycolate phosphatase
VLLLFDIDGTLLLRASAEHAVAVHEAIRAVWGVVAPAGARVEAAGRTDVEIARAICTLAGVDAARVDAGIDDFRIATAEAYARLAPRDLRAHVAPGIPDALAALAARPRARLALLTGNLEPVARLKLARAGLGGWFVPGQGAFGSDDEDRTRLPAIARRRAGDGPGAPYPRERTVVIGDTPRDIACARADGIRCVALATGPYGAADLRGADVVLDSAHDLVAALSPDGCWPPRSGVENRLNG